MAVIHDRPGRDAVAAMAGAAAAEKVREEFGRAGLVASSAPRSRYSEACMSRASSSRSRIGDAIVADNGWDNDCRSRMIRFEADGQSFKVKVPRRSRAGDNDSIGAVQMAVRLDKMMRQTASLTGRAWDGWRQEQLAWLFSPHQPSYYAKSG